LKVKLIVCDSNSFLIIYNGLVRLNG